MSRPVPPPNSRNHPDEFEVDVRRGHGSHALLDPYALSPRLRRRRALSLVLLTLVAPGSAQIAAGNRRLGRGVLKLAAVVVGLLVLAALTYLVAPAVIIGLAANPWILAAFTAALVLAGFGWAVLFVDAIRLAQLKLVPGRTRRLVAGLGVILMVLTSGTLFTAAATVWSGRSALTSVFGGHTRVKPAAGRYNILLLGGDSGASRIGTRPDTIMLASIDADTGRTALFGFARDTENINFNPGSVMHELMPEGWNCGDGCLLNGLYKWATDNKDRFPADVKDPGALATVEAVEALSGVEIQYHALVDLKGFRRFIDAVGGIDVVVGKRTPIGGGTSPITGWIEPGQQHLDGYHALWYARSREGSTNYERMVRQKCVMNAMLNQISPQTVILKSREIADLSGSVLRTDIPDSDLGVLGELARKAREQKITSVNFTPPLIKPWDYDPQVVKDTVRSTIEATEQPQESTPKTDPGAAAGSADSGAGQTSSPGSGKPTQPAGSSERPSAASAGEICSVP
ncbi:LCP family protein [Gephyromycinifex aptenodytis]|uniref:LCP family protein n=1 Tax=Gephyromycinifex aptenodytis TaxID=2716227 RepID=UPI001447AB2B|nr:LCP family protein [Gephyromycinifex aptenodytis]